MVNGTHCCVIFVVMMILIRIVSEQVMILISSTLITLFCSIIEDNGNVGLILEIF